MQHYYNDAGEKTASYELAPNSAQVGMSVPAGQWHALESLEEGSVIFECKGGALPTLVRWRYTGGYAGRVVIGLGKMQVSESFALTVKPQHNFSRKGHSLHCLQSGSNWLVTQHSDPSKVLIE